MNGILLLSTRRQPAPGRAELGSMPRIPANDEVLPMVTRLEAPEATIVVSFVGLNEAEQRRALDSFPGGRRCLIAEA